MLFVGTSGWQYRDWRGPFYPRQLPQRDWLRYYSERFRSVELNNSFYHLPDRRAFERWRQETPEDFVVAVKMSRFLTHLKRLRDPAEPVQRFLEHAAGLGDKLGPVLIQLPPNLPVEPDRLTDTLDRFPAGVRVAVEARHDSWFCDRVRTLLEDRGAALCLADSPHRRTPFWRTADWGFVRFHEGRASPRPCYGRHALQRWVGRIAGLWPNGEDIYCYFNNDMRGCAVRDAAVFGRIALTAGLATSRVPVRTFSPSAAS